MHKLMK